MTAQIIPVAVFDLVVFGGTGDLAMRKLLPALYWRESDQQMPEGSRIIGVARSHLTTPDYLAQVEAACRKHVGAAFDPAVFARLAQRITFVPLDVASCEHWADLAHALVGAEDRPRLFYLATSPDLFGPICEGAGAAGIVTPEARVVLEKPLGHDLASAIRINDQVGRVFAESQVYRIDHYLGKESVQNLLALRFANSLFESVWDRAHIDHVQITVAETVGVEERAAYYDRSGALRDMVQNHLLQLLCLVAMEPPISMAADAVRDEKLKVLHSLRSLADGDALQKTVRGQYRAGIGDGASVPGYAEELGAPSRTETFVALKAEVESWRWAGVPFYLRTGKRLATRASEIVVQYRNVPYSIFREASRHLVANRLVLRLQPDEGMKLYLMSKDPGPGGLRFKNEPLNLSYAESLTVGYRDAYERLLMDVVRGNATLFMRKDELEAAWRWIDPILDGWAAEHVVPRPYPAGSWGPSDATALIARDGRAWHEDFA